MNTRANSPEIGQPTNTITWHKGPNKSRTYSATERRALKVGVYFRAIVPDATGITPWRKIYIKPLDRAAYNICLHFIQFSHTQLHWSSIAIFLRCIKAHITLQPLFRHHLKDMFVTENILCWFKLHYFCVQFANQILKHYLNQWWPSILTHVPLDLNEWNKRRYAYALHITPQN